MRDTGSFQEQLFSIKRTQDFTLGTHSLHSICEQFNRTLVKLYRLFTSMYSADRHGGRSCITPDRCGRW